MTTNIFKLAAILLLMAGITSCQNKNEGENDVAQLSDEQILSILLSNGEISGYNDPELLIGEWEAVRFAYTDEVYISNVAAISRASLEINSIPLDFSVGCDFELENLVWRLGVWNTSLYFCSILDNLIDITFCYSTYVLVPSPHEEYDIAFAIGNARSFVVRGDELIIYFNGDDEHWKDNFKFKENKNLLILKKR